MVDVRGDFISLSGDKEAEIIEAFNSTSRYFDDLLNINNIYFGMANHIYPSELQLNKANSSDTEAPFLDLHLTISDEFVASKIMISVTILILLSFHSLMGRYSSCYTSFGGYISLRFLDGNIPHATSKGFIYLSSFGSLECLVM